MELTPVKARGKGPRKSGFKPPNPKRVKLTTDQNDPGSSVFQKSSAAPIERLPVEILHKILLLSREHNFPRASLRIGMSLSHPSFITEVVLQAFEPTWDLWLGCLKRRVKSYAGWYEDTERFGGDPELQSKVVALPFVTIDLVIAAQQRWVIKNGPTRYCQHSDKSEDHFNGFHDGAINNNGVPHGFRGLGHMNSAIACFEKDFEEDCFFHMPPINDRHFRLEVHPGIRIPDRLITGPLTRKDMRLFYWLVYNGALCTADQTWEMSLQGVRNLFEQDDVEIANFASHLLWAAGGFHNIPQGMPPIPLGEALQKLVAHRNDGPWRCHYGCAWRPIVERLFDLVGMNDTLAVASGGL